MAATAWFEMGGTRRIEDNKPHFIDYIATFQNEVSGSDWAAIPAVGSTLATVVGSGTFGATGLIAEPTSRQNSAVDRATPNKQRITIRFRGEYVRA
uniref:Uncharacterized protein n=1 Tax=viral metagenome TaxID=1070528 RepID=A0A6M3LBH7_9ZZZZ